LFRALVADDLPNQPLLLVSQVATFSTLPAARRGLDRFRSVLFISVNDAAHGRVGKPTQLNYAHHANPFAMQSHDLLSPLV
jgi:hypothetical protein